MDDLAGRKLGDGEAVSLMAEWRSDEVNRILRDLWGAALDSRADTYVGEDGEVGELSEDEYIRVATLRMRAARAELDRIYGKS